MIWLPEERMAEHEVSPVSMSYTARHPACGHVRAVALDKRNGSLDEFIAMSLTGLILSRESTEIARADLGECSVCRPPEQDEMGL